VQRRVLLVCLLALGACRRSDPERELRATIETMAQAIEQREPADLLDSLSEDFTRESGTFGKAEARRVLAGVLIRNERIQVSTAVTDVRIEGDRAFAKVRVIATGSAGLLPERGQAWEFDTVWRREQGRWKVFNAEWREGL
jgi:ketosteroid isomerase-like protein